MRARLLFLVLVLGLSGAAAFYFLRPLTLREDPLQNAPSGTSALLSVDVAAVWNSALWRTFVTERGGDARFRALQERCGIDPTEQVERLVAFVGGDTPRNLDAVTVIAQGPFDHDRLGECMRDVVEEGGGTLREVELDGVPAVAGGRGDSRIAFLGTTGAVFGQEPAVRRVIATLQGERSDLRTEQPALAALWDHVAEGSEVGFAANLPETWRAAIRRRMSRETRGIAAGLLTELSALGAGARVSRGLALGLVFEFETEERAVDAGVRVEAERAQLLDQPLLGLSAAGAALRLVRVEAADRRLTVAVDLDQRRVDGLLELWTEMQQARRSEE